MSLYVTLLLGFWGLRLRKLGHVSCTIPRNGQNCSRWPGLATKKS